jgi:hypothetical protein
LLKRTDFVAHNWRWLYQFDYFRHDCSFAAIAADFEGGGVTWGWSADVLLSGFGGVGVYKMLLRMTSFVH